MKEIPLGNGRKGQVVVSNPKFECRNPKQARRLKSSKFKTPVSLGWFETLGVWPLEFVSDSVLRASDFNTHSATGLHQVSPWQQLPNDIDAMIVLFPVGAGPRACPNHPVVSGHSESPYAGWGNPGKGNHRGGHGTVNSLDIR